jgi:hypothetical protein
MRGATQAHLVRLGDGSCWVVKFANGPVGVRGLVNGLVCSLLLSELGIATPRSAVIHVNEDFLQRNPGVLLTRDGALWRPTRGRHLGSRFPGDPGSTAVFDFMPDALLSRVVNGDDFLGALLFDVWTCNAAPRQAIFYREEVDDGAAGGARAVRWLAQMIGHDRAFGGARWQLSDLPRQALYGHRVLHARRPSMRDFAPWIARLMALPQRVLDEILQCVPAEWICGEERQARELIARLLARRNLVPLLLAQTLASLPEVGRGEQAWGESKGQASPTPRASLS